MLCHPICNWLYMATVQVKSKVACQKTLIVTLRCGVLQCVAVCCSVLQCVAVCCSVLQCVEVCCNVKVACLKTQIAIHIVGDMHPGAAACRTSHVHHQYIYIYIYIYIHIYKYIVANFHRTS